MIKFKIFEVPINNLKKFKKHKSVSEIHIHYNFKNF